MIISVATGKAFDKNQHSFMMKKLNKATVKEMYLNITEAIYVKPTPVSDSKAARCCHFYSPLYWES